MKEQEEIDYINKHKKQARQLHPNAIVVPVERARSSVERAYRKGFEDGREHGISQGVDAARRLDQGDNKPLSDEEFLKKLTEYNRRVYNEFNPEDYE